MEKLFDPANGNRVVIDVQPSGYIQISSCGELNADNKICKMFLTIDPVLVSSYESLLWGRWLQKGFAPASHGTGICVGRNVQDAAKKGMDADFIVDASFAFRIPERKILVQATSSFFSKGGVGTTHWVATGCITLKAMPQQITIGFDKGVPTGVVYHDRLA